MRPRPESWVDAPMPPGVTGLATTRDHVQGRSTGAWARFNLALHTGDDPTAVQTNRSLLAVACQARWVQWLDQVHGVQVMRAEPSTTASAPHADAAWTDQPGLALCVQTADCVPVLIAARDRSVVGAAHAGWRGLADGVLEALLAAMPLDPAQACAWIGPCISASHYEVGEDVWGRFVDETGESAIQPHPDTPGKRLLDLAALTQTILQRSGLREVTQSGACTYADPRFYSHRRDAGTGQGQTGRIGTLIMIDAPG